VGTYAIGMRHSWRFSHVQAMAGAPSWLQYLGRTSATDRQVVTPWSGLHLAENSSNTRFYYYHGLTDGGPMRPEFVREFSRRMQELGVPNNETWLDAGHDILNMAMRHGRRFDQLTAPRDPRPAEVRMVSGDYRAARQHWIEITRFAQFNTLGRARGRVNERALTLTTENVSALRLHVSDMPFTGEVRDEVTLTVDGHEVYRGPREALGTHLQLARVGGTWRTGLLPHVAGRLEKRPGLSGPVGDAYFGRIVHVYGTQREGSTADLRAAAERGSRGFLLWGWDIRQEVIPDTDAGQPQYRDATLMLYGAPGDNAVLDALADRLPIRMDGAAVVVGQQRYAGADVGVRYIYPNPDNPARYVIVSTGVNAGVIRAASNLPEFLPDWFVYNQATVRNTQPRVAGRRNPEVASGFFDDHWQLPGATTTSAGAAPAGGSAAPAGSGAGAGEGGGDDDETPVVVSTLPVPRAPAVPGPPARFLVPETDPAGPAARAMWQRIPEFFNFRAHIPGAEWRVNTAQQFAVRPEAECLADLVRLGRPGAPAAGSGHPRALPRGAAGARGRRVVPLLSLRAAHPDRLRDGRAPARAGGGAQAARRGRRGGAQRLPRGALHQLPHHGHGARHQPAVPRPGLAVGAVALRGHARPAHVQRPAARRRRGARAPAHRLRPVPQRQVPERC
jgi:hypothetical protein